MFGKTCLSRDISDLALQTELKHPLFDSEQHFLESQSLLHFLFLLQELRNEIASGPVHGSQSWKVPLLMRPLTLGFLPWPHSASRDSPGQNAQPCTLAHQWSTCEIKLTDENWVKASCISHLFSFKHGYKSLCLVGLSRSCSLLYTSFSLANEMKLQIQMRSKKPQRRRSCPKNAGCCANVLSQQTRL